MAAIAVAGLAACGSDDAESADASEEPPAGAVEAPAEAIGAGDSGSDDSGGDGSDGDDALTIVDGRSETGGVADLGAQIDLSDRDIITSVSLTMSTADVRATADDVRRIAETNGAAVFSSDVTIGDERDDGSVPGGGQIVIRVVPAQLDGLVSALDGAGVVTRLAQDSQDVTDQLIDLDIRIRQIETSIERLEMLLEGAAALADVFDLERELTDRVIELEQLRAQERATENLVALATLTVDIEYRTPDALDEIETGDDGIADAFSDGWSAFVGFVFTIGYVLAISAPFIVALLAVVVACWWMTRRLTRRAAERRERSRQAADLPQAPPPPVAASAVSRDDASPVE